MAENQDKDRRNPNADDQNEGQQRRADSGDVSGKGRERRDDGAVYPAHRNAGDFGTHGGPNKSGKQNANKPGPETQDV